MSSSQRSRVLGVATLAILALAVAAGPAPLRAAAPYEPAWESLDQRPCPGWFRDAKFGIFIHWGVYSVPGYAPKDKYAEWYWRWMEQGKSRGTTEGKEGATWKYHLDTYGEDFPYHGFAPMFKAQLYDPDHWADIFRRSGARYVVLTSKHHDGFCLWPSAHANRSWGRPWNSVDTGPRRDLLGDLTRSVREAGLRMGIYYSLYEWYNPLWQTDRALYVDKHMLPQFRDVVSRYRPSIIFSDGEWDMTADKWRSEELLAWLYNESPVKEEVVVNDRWGKGTRHKHGGYHTTEYTSGIKDSDAPWEESRGMGHSYGYNRYETIDDYKSGRELLLILIDMVSRGGNLLLDIGPTGDGRIPVIMEERLLEIGEWMAVNGEAIYGTRPWRENRQWSDGEVPRIQYGGTYMVKYDILDVTGERKGDKAVIDAFFTRKEDTLYAISPRWPRGGRLLLEGVSPGPSSTVTLLGGADELEWSREGDGILVEIPASHRPTRVPQEIVTVRVTGIR